MSQQERDLQLTQAMSVERPFVDVPLILQTDFFRKDADRFMCPFR